MSTVIRKMLDLSTAHLPADIGMIDGERNILSLEGVIAYDHGEYGYLLWVPDDLDEDALWTLKTVPEEIRAIQRYARANDCDYVLIDRDAAVDDNLPTWEW